MKSVHDLSTDELEELRGNYFAQLKDDDPDILGDIFSAKEIPMSNVISHYEGVYFVNDDFFCNL